MIPRLFSVLLVAASPGLADDVGTTTPQVEPAQACDACSARKKGLLKLKQAREADAAESAAAASPRTAQNSAESHADTQ
ncbi:MAG: hypothetical protein AAF484_13070 [Pseudomonadota bacterium]